MCIKSIFLYYYALYITVVIPHQSTPHYCCENKEVRYSRVINSCKSRRLPHYDNYVDQVGLGLAVSFTTLISHNFFTKLVHPAPTAPWLVLQYNNRNRRH